MPPSAPGFRRDDKFLGAAVLGYKGELSILATDDLAAVVSVASGWRGGRPCCLAARGPKYAGPGGLSKAVHGSRLLTMTPAVACGSGILV